MNVVPSLLKLAELYIVENFDNVESLFGFPELMGKSLFDALDSHCQCTNKDMNKYLQVFANAYDDVLSSLNLRGQLVIINEYLDNIKSTFSNITALDISNCHLGRNHDIIDCLTQMDRLTILHLSNCSIDDEVVRKITIPCRLYSKGIVNLKEMDLSGNPKLTSKCLSFLNCLKQLVHLRLPTGFSLKKESILLCLSAMGFSEENVVISPVSTQGWAVPVINRWSCTKSPPRPLSKASGSVFSHFYGRNVKRRKVLISPGETAAETTATFICLTRQLNKVPQNPIIKSSKIPFAAVNTDTNLLAEYLPKNHARIVRSEQN